MYGHNVVNMLAAKKIRLHGMKTPKWTTEDRISQYKGLINLYTRDRKVIDQDTVVNRRKLNKELKDIAKQVYADRRALDNEIRGDKQTLRNILADYKEIQMGYQNSEPKKVIERLDQANFEQKKALDKMKYDMKVKSRKLMDLTLEQALLEDRLKYEVLREIKKEKEAQIITGKVQDATLRKEAALAIHNIYKEILDIMKKDAMYFDVILATVENDGYNQSKCFLGATKLGQLATEYLDDRRQEFTTLERIIRADMQVRKEDIQELTEKVDTTSASLKLLLRRDSDITTCAVKKHQLLSNADIENDVKQVEKVLLFLKEETAVPSFEAIYPCLRVQVEQRHRLRKLWKKNERNRDYLLNKVNHAELLNQVLKTTATEQIASYVKEKGALAKEVGEMEEETETLRKSIKYRKDLAAKIRIALSQLLELSNNIKSHEAMRKESAGAQHLLSMGAKVHKPKEAKEVEIPTIDETDGTKIVSILITKFTTLMSTYYSRKRAVDIHDCLKEVETMMQPRIILREVETTISEISLLQGMYQENSNCLTRDDLKRQSEAIVEENSINEDLIVPVRPGKWKRFT